MNRVSRASTLAVICGAALQAFACSSGNDMPVPVETDAGIDTAETSACTADKTSCGGACVDLQNSHDNCGTCGTVCAAAEACVDGKCSTACPGGQEVCGGACVTTDTDNANCGACGNKCAAGMVCSKGACATSCASDLAVCGGGDAGAARCANLRTDNENCGACDVKCGDGQSCSMGKCLTTCGAGMSTCSGADGGTAYCANLKTDNANCGACGTSCGAGMVCSDGKCATTCASSLTTCGGDGGATYCADIKTDIANCGACGKACATGESCFAGSCVALCSGGKTACLGTGTLYCADLTKDIGDCGKCGAACAVNEQCFSGACALPDLNVTADVNLSTTNIAGRTCADGGDMVSYSVTTLTSTTATLSASVASGCVQVGDEVLLINVQGTATANANVGNYEVLKVASASDKTVTFAAAKTKSYGEGAGDDTGIGTARTNQRVILQRVAQYNNVTIDAGKSVTANAWNGTRGGILAFRAKGAVKVAGTISMKGAGYVGGARTTVVNTTGAQGESFGGLGVVATQAANGGAGGGGRGDNTSCNPYGHGGGGGANAVAGNLAQASSCGGGAGGAYGSTSKLTLGSGGGGGGTDNDLSTNPPGATGGAGGGIVWIAAPSVEVTGSIDASGIDGEGDVAGYETANVGFTTYAWDYSGPGGGGAGGTLRIDAPTITGTDKLSIIGGNGGNGSISAARDGGSGGRGWLIGVTTTYTSCKQIKAADATAKDGMYWLATDSTGATPFPAHCDMTFDGGGWTLVLDSNKLGPVMLPVNVGVAPSSGRVMNAADIKRLATAATQVHIRSTDDTSRSATSNADSTPIVNLRNNIMMNGGAGTGTASDWTGPFATNAYMSWTCGVGNNKWPNMYQCCGTNGLHLNDVFSRWTWGGTEEPLQVYVR
jgi:hypothetical protein